MNVALVLRRFTTDGGTERYAVGLARHLVSRGARVFVYCAFVRPDVASLPGVVVRRVSPARPGGVVGEAWFAFASLVARLGRHDVIHGFGRTFAHDIYRAGGGAHEAWIRARDPSVGGRVRRWFDPMIRAGLAVDRQVQTLARVVVCNSWMAARQVSVFHGIEPHRIRVIRNGVDATRFRPDPLHRLAARVAWGVPERGKVALFLGNGFRRKGLAVAAEAFVRVAGATDRFVVAGGDAHAERHLRPIRARLGSRLIVAGAWVDPERWIPGADATLLATLYDSAANTVLESLSCGVPSVTTSMDGNSELVPDRSWVVRDPRSPDGVAEALRAAWQASDPERCRAVALDWPVSRNGDAMFDLYREIVDGRT